MFVPNGEHDSGEGISLPKHLHILIEALATNLSKGVRSGQGLQRVDVLQKGLRRRLTMLRRYCKECRIKMSVASVFTLMANVVDGDLDRWVRELFDAATTFGKLHVSPPAAAKFPAVVTPALIGLTSCIAAGGLRNSFHQLEHRSSAAGSGMTKARTFTHKDRPQYWFVFALGAGCSRSARDCRRLHPIDPNKCGSKRGEESGANKSISGCSRGGSRAKTN